MANIGGHSPERFRELYAEHLEKTRVDVVLGVTADEEDWLKLRRRKKKDDDK